MDSLKKELAQRDGIVAVEHRIETTWSDDRAPYAYTAAPVRVVAGPLCRDVTTNMEALASVHGESA